MYTFHLRSPYFTKIRMTQALLHTNPEKRVELDHTLNQFESTRISIGEPISQVNAFLIGRKLFQVTYGCLICDKTQVFFTGCSQDIHYDVQLVVIRNGELLVCFLLDVLVWGEWETRFTWKERLVFYGVMIL